MGLEPLGIDNRQAMGREEAPQGEHREVREVLMVDGVELVALHEAEEVWHLDCQQAVVGEEYREPGDEVVFADPSFVMYKISSMVAGATLAAGGRDMRPSLRGGHRGRREIEHRLQGARHEWLYGAAQTRGMQGQPEA